METLVMKIKSKFLIVLITLMMLGLAACGSSKLAISNDQPTIEAYTTSTPSAFTTTAIPFNSPVPTKEITLSPTEIAKYIPVVGQAGADINIRSGPGTIYPKIAQISDGQSVMAKGVSLDGNWAQIIFPSQPNGIAWVSVSYLTKGVNDLPVITDPTQYQPVLPPDKRPLNLQSSIDDIRKLVLSPSWSTLWVEGQVANALSDGHSQYVFSQGWLVRDGVGEVVSSNTVLDNSNRLPNTPVQWIWTSDGKILQKYNAKTGSLESTPNQQPWTLHPLEMTGDLMGMLFPSYAKDWNNQPLHIVDEETIATRPALVVDWGDRRFWIDEGSGVILREQIFSSQSRNDLVKTDIIIKRIYYMIDVPANLLNTDHLNNVQFEEIPGKNNLSNQGSSKAIEAIRNFRHQEISDYIYRGEQFNPNVPNEKNDLYIVDGAQYFINIQTNQIVEFEAQPTTMIGGLEYSQDELQQKAVQFIQSFIPGFQFQTYTLEASNKLSSTFFFRWSSKEENQNTNSFIQLTYTLNGQLIGYINTLARG
jgi:Bacterial SH3 domain